MSKNIKECDHEVVSTENSHFVYCTKCKEDLFIDDYNWYLVKKEKCETSERISELEQQLLKANAKNERLVNAINKSNTFGIDRYEAKAILQEAVKASSAQSLKLYVADVVDYIHDEIIDACETAEECRQEIVSYTIILRNSVKEGE